MKTRFYFFRYPACYNSPSSFILVFIILFMVTPVMAQSWYIKPSAEIPLRRGMGTGFKILAIVPDGTEVSIIEENDPWVRVETQEGKKGWILKRYLTLEEPLNEVVDSLRQENAMLLGKNSQLSVKYDEVAQKSESVQKELTTCMANLTESGEQYKTLMQDTSDVIQIKNNLTQSRQTVTKLQEELGEVTNELRHLKTGNNIKWFLAGGGTLIFGWIAGMMSRKSKKKRSSLY